MWHNEHTSMLPIRADRAEPEIDHRREKPGEADNELDRAICFRIKPLREISEGKEAMPAI
jgi:hypothetical protein